MRSASNLHSPEEEVDTAPGMDSSNAPSAVTKRRTAPSTLICCRCSQLGLELLYHEYVAVPGAPLTENVSVVSEYDDVPS
jgi:hypothetical protein